MMQTAKLLKICRWQINAGRDGGQDLQLTPYLIATLNKNSKCSFIASLNNYNYQFTT
jgi:hypothetical protein